MAFADQLESIQEQLKNFDINDLSADNIGIWPLPVKIITWVLLFVILIFGGYKLIINDMQFQLTNETRKEDDLKKQFETKAFQAVNLDAYRKQMLDMEESFGALISQLPSDTEVPGLLEDITNKGATSGLIFETIGLQPEQTKEFYIELPIRIVASGTYHDMGAFVSGVASLPRIVTLSNFVINPQGKGADSSKLRIEITASTYRYRDLGNVSGLGKKGQRK